MKAKLPALWAQTPASNRREPTAQELATGFSCGPADINLFNEMEYRRAQAEAELDHIITSGGLTPNETRLTQVLEALRILFPQRQADNTTLFVRTDGNDTTGDGSANTAAKAFATIGGAITYASSRLFLGGNLLTIQLGNTGIYTPPGNVTASGRIRIVGDTANRDSYSIQGAGPAAGGGCLVSANGGCAITLSGLRVVNTGTINAHIGASGSSSIAFDHVSFLTTVATGQACVLAAVGGTVTCGVNNIFVGFSSAAFLASGGSILITANVAVTPTPTYTAAFAVALNNGSIVVQPGVTFSGAATGVRYAVSVNGSINTSGGGINLFPGTSAGTTQTGGQYV